ncbi:polysaccharide pyruvyl transferase family protein [Brachybacterium sp. Z12]|nr:polysaccharide pyruvyl transferase family protein [Brachybacterium sp. Z12]
MPLTIPRSILKEAVLRKRGLGAWFTSFDIILDTRAGDSFADIYTLSYLIRMSTAPFYAMALGVPLVMTPQTIGPFSSRRARLLAAQTLSRARAVMVRDDQSIDTVRRLANREPIQSTDVAFALPRPLGPSSTTCYSTCPGCSGSRTRMSITSRTGRRCSASSTASRAAGARSRSSIMCSATARLTMTPMRAGRSTKRVPRCSR